MRILLLAGILSAGARAQSLAEPPPIVQLVRKPGIGGVSVRPYANARAAINVIGMTAITGLPETWLVELHASFASIEDLDRGLSAAGPMRTANDPLDPLQDDVLAPSRTMIALYRNAWSYRPDQAIRMLPKARYMQVSVFRIRHGMEAEFGESVRLRRATADTVNLDRPELAYQVMSGAPAGTFLFLSPILSLRTMDEGIAPLPVYAEGLAAARAKDGTRITAETEISREHLWFRIEPRISYVFEDFAQADPEFWRGKAK